MTKLPAYHYAFISLLLASAARAVPVAVNDAYTAVEDTAFVPNGPPLINANFNSGAESWTYVDDAFGTNAPGYALGTVSATRGVDSTGCLLVDIGRRPPSPRSSSGAFTRTINLNAGATVEFKFSYRLRAVNTVYSGLFQRYAEAVFTVGGIRYGDGAGDSLLRLTVPQAEGTQDSDWQQATLNITLGAGTHTVQLGAYSNSTGDSNHYVESLYDNVTVNVSGTGTVLANDTGGVAPVTATKLTNPANGAIVFNSNGNFTYTPNANFNGTDSFTYRANDGTGGSNTATVTFNVTPVNDAPGGVTDSYTTAEDTPLTISPPGVLTNDTDVDNAAASLVATGATQPVNGTLSGTGNGGFTYTPRLNFNGADSFTYIVSDGTAQSAPVTVNLTVTPVPDAPQPVADAYLASAGSALIVNQDTLPAGTAVALITAAPDTPNGGTAQPGDLWKYLDNGTDQGTTWRDRTFNDTTWKSGRGELGYGDASNENRPEYTVIEDNATPGYNSNDTNRYITYYFRKSFSLGDSRKFADLQMSLLRDDGAVVFLNGSRVYFENGLDGATYLTTTAASSSNEITHVSLALPNAAQYLVDGDNLLAVEIHQAAADSSDLSFDLGLTATERPYSGVLANDVEPEGQSMTASLVTSPAHGTLVFNANGTFTYTPAAGYQGPDTFIYRATDGTLTSPDATVAITVGPPVNQPPVTSPNTYNTNEDVPLTVNAAFGVLANDVDPEGSPMTAVLVSAPANGTLSLAADGSFLFTPAANWSGSTSFVYRASDGLKQSVDTAVSLNVTSVPDVPVAVADTYRTTIGTALVVNATTPGGSSPITLITAAPETPNGGPALPGDTWRFLDNGTDQGTGWRDVSFDDSAWKEGAGELGYGDISDNRPEYTLIEDNPVPGYSAASDRFITSYFRKAFSIADRNRVTGLAMSLLRDDGVAIYLNGNRLYAEGALASASPLTYLTPATITANEATHEAIDLPNAAQFLQDGVNVLAVEVHQTAPTSSDVSFDLGLTGVEASYAGVLYNDSDAEGNPFTASVAMPPAHGTLSLAANGTFTYTPAAGFSGTDTFTYRATDATGPSAPATVSIIIGSGANQKPTAVSDSYTVVEDVIHQRPAVTGVLANDTDPEGDTLTAVLVATTTRGTLTLNPDGSFTYLAAANFNGLDTFTYRARDSGNLLSAAVTVNLTVSASNDAPLAAADSFGTDPGVILTVPVAQSILGNDTDMDGDILTAQLVSPPSSGSLTLNANGSFIYTPAAAGTFTFTYAAHDGTVASAPATVTIGVNGRPVANNDSYNVAEDSTLSPAAPGVIANDTDPESSPLTATAATQPLHGTLSLSASGAFTYTPAANYTGPDSFTYTVSDGSRASLPGTVSLTITPVNDAPVARADNYTVIPGQPLNVSAAQGILSNDSDIENSPLTLTQLTNPAGGVLTLATDGSFTYVPSGGFSSSDSFTYRVSDGALTSVPATVTITVEQPGDNIVINEIMYRPGTGFPENTSLEFIELHNRSANAIALTGWTISAGVAFSFPAGTTMASGSFLVIAANVASFQAAHPGVANVIGGWTGTLANGGEKIELTSATGTAQDRVRYASEGDWAQRMREPSFNGWEWTTPADGGGRSLELRNPQISNDNGQNWVVSSVAGGTPGAANSALTANIPPVIKAVKHSPAVPTSSDRVTISCELNDESAVTALTATLFWRDATITTPGAWQTVAMSSDGKGRWFAPMDPRPNLAIAEFYISASDGANTRTWPAPTTEGQNANCQYQVDNGAASTTAEMYRLILTEEENQAFATVSQSSDRQFNQTLIVTRGQESDVRYRCDMRIRGNSSRSYQFKPLRISIPGDDDLNGSTRFNLNPKASHLQHLGMRLFQSAGLRAPDTIPAELRRNGVEYTTSSGSTPDYGQWVRLEDLNGEMVQHQWPLASSGGIYKKGRPDNYWRATQPPPNNPDTVFDGWLKQNNSAANDWSDLTSFFTAWMAACAPHFPGSAANDVAGSGGGSTSGIGNWAGTAFSAGEITSAETVADLDQWARWFAVMTIFQDNETNISNGQDDDYGVYFEPRTVGATQQRRLQFIPHDLDTIFGLGDSPLAFNTTGLYDMTEQSSVFRPLLPLFGTSTVAGNAAFRTKYFNALLELFGTVFDADNSVNPNPPFYQLVDYHLGNWSPAANRTAIKTFVTQRRSYLLGLIGSAATTPSAGTSNATVTSAHGTLFISEVLANNVAAHNNSGTFPDVIELHNTGASAVSLADLSLTDDPLVKSKYVFPSGSSLAAGARLVLYADTAATPGTHLGFGLDNDGDTIHLYNTAAAGQALIDSITFGLQAADLSIGRTGTALDTWALCTPTIGAANTAVAALAAPAGLRINEWLGNADYRAAEDFIELYNGAALPVALGGMSLTDDFINYPARHVILPLSFMAAGAFVAFEAKGAAATPGNTRELPFKIGSSTGSVALLGANGAIVDRGETLPQFRDVSMGRVPDGTGVFTPLAPPSPGYTNVSLPAGALDLLNYLRITEMMYNPATTAQSEYIEFRNISHTAAVPVTLDLSGVTFKNGIAFTFAAGTILTPGAFLVIAGEPAKFLAQFPTVPVAGVFTGKLDNGGERLRFDIPGYNIAILDFSYSDNWHPSTDGGGDALQIVSATASPAMWDQQEGWQAIRPNPGTVPPFSVYAGPDISTVSGVPVYLDGALNPGTFTLSAISIAWTKESGPGTVTFTTGNWEDANATFTAPGIYVLRLTATAPGPATVTDLITIAVEEIYNVWAARLLPGASSADRLKTADPDRDGLTNLAEYLLGTLPGISDALNATALSVADGYLGLEYRRSLTVDATVQVIPQISSDLVVWNENPGSISHTLLSTANGIETWRARDAQPLTPGQRRYIRLRIVSP